MTLWAFPPVDSNSSTLAITANILVVVNILSYIFLAHKLGFENNILKISRKDTDSDTRSCRCDVKEQMYEMRYGKQSQPSWAGCQRLFVPLSQWTGGVQSRALTLSCACRWALHRSHSQLCVKCPHRRYPSMGPHWLRSCKSCSLIDVTILDGG
jgi:hypothetical protein